LQPIDFQRSNIHLLDPVSVLNANDSDSFRVALRTKPQAPRSLAAAEQNCAKSYGESRTENIPAISCSTSCPEARPAFELI
jgi:hypothetical protein